MNVSLREPAREGIPLLTVLAVLEDEGEVPRIVRLTPAQARRPAGSPPDRITRPERTRT